MAYTMSPNRKPLNPRKKFNLKKTKMQSLIYYRIITYITIMVPYVPLWYCIVLYGIASPISTCLRTILHTLLRVDKTGQHLKRSIQYSFSTSPDTRCYIWSEIRALYLPNFSLLKCVVAPRPYKLAKEWLMLFIQSTILKIYF